MTCQMKGNFGGNTTFFPIFFILSTFGKNYMYKMNQKCIDCQ